MPFSDQAKEAALPKPPNFHESTVTDPIADLLTRVRNSTQRAEG